MRQNPFRLDFGAEPNLFIPRYPEQDKIIETFSSENPVTHIYLIVGARGTGKTVLMTSASHKLREANDWIHIDLNSESDMLNALASGISTRMTSKFPKLKFEFSFKGISISAEKTERYRDIQTDLDAMLEVLKKRGIRVLITVDEIYNSKDNRMFMSFFQHCLRENYPVFALMTGLYKNIRSLQNNRSQTFLKRTPRIHLGSLNTMRIAKQYEEVFGISDREASDMANLTAGYSYGFQILGYLIYENGKNKVDDKVLYEYKMSLFENSYDKIWEELSEGERSVAAAIASSAPNSSVKAIREAMDIDSNKFSTYADTLKKSGLLSANSAYGRMNFSLPYFGEFVLAQ